MEMGFDWFGYSWSGSSLCCRCVTFGYFMYTEDVDYLKVTKSRDNQSVM